MALTMKAPEEIMKALVAQFPAEDIEHRVGRVSNDGTKVSLLAYITARGVMDRLDDVFGIGGWSDTYERWGVKGIKCRLSVLIGGEWVAKEDGADETDIESTKGGISDALKRVAVKIGIGRYLYLLPKTEVLLTNQWADGAISHKGKYAPRPILPAWALPGGSGRPPVKATSDGTKTGSAQATGTTQRAPASPTVLPQGAAQPSGSDPTTTPMTWPAVSEAASRHKVGTKELLSLAGVDSWDKVKAFSPERLAALVAVIEGKTEAAA